MNTLPGGPRRPLVASATRSRRVSSDHRLRAVTTLPAIHEGRRSFVLMYSIFLCTRFAWPCAIVDSDVVGAGRRRPRAGRSRVVRAAITPEMIETKQPSSASSSHSTCRCQGRWCASRRSSRRGQPFGAWVVETGFFMLAGTTGQLELAFAKLRARVAFADGCRRGPTARQNSGRCRSRRFPW